MTFRLRTVTRSLRCVHAAAHGETAERTVVLLELSDPATGLTGAGEAAPLQSFDGVTVAHVLDALADCTAAIEAHAADPGDLAAADALRTECRRRAVLPQAVAAIDLALWDLAGQARGCPVHALLGAGEPAPVPVNATVAASDRAGAAAAAAAAVAAGFRTVKVKVGLGDDAGRLAAVRAAVGPQLQIRLDANGAWSPAEAAAYLRVLAPAGIELCEEPVHGLAAFAELRALLGADPATRDLPVALDESSSLPGALTARHADAVCLKIAASGGISGLLADAATARAAGYEVYLASTLDGPLGIAAALHAAAAVGPVRPCGLATLAGFAPPHDAVAGLQPAAGTLRPPPGPGLGAGLRDWY